MNKQAITFKEFCAVAKVQLNTRANFDETEEIDMLRGYYDTYKHNYLPEGYSVEEYCSIIQNGHRLEFTV